MAKLGFGTGIGQTIQRIKQGIDAVVILLEDQAIIIAGILAPFGDQMTTDHPFGTGKDFEPIPSDALIDFINHGFFGVVGFMGFDETQAGATL